MTPKQGKVKNSVQLAAALEALDTRLEYDIRGSRIIDSTGRPMTEQDMDVLVDRLAIEGYDVPTRRTDLGKRVWNAYLMNRSFDPLQRWLEWAERQGDPIPPSEFPHLCWPGRVNKTDAELVEWGWGALMLAVVARAFAPPVRWDVVPIIQGPQGCGKSTAVTNLLPARWTNGGFPLSGIKDFDSGRKTAEFTEGKALLESSEMVGMKASTREPVKAFLTQDTDRATRKWAIQAEDTPRRWCIVGTTNDRDPIPYDPSGGRRWIVTAIEDMVPDDGPRIAAMLTDIRPRLWAGAMMDYREHVAQTTDGVFPQDALSVPPRLQSLHERHVKCYMWHPPQAGLFGRGLG